MLMLLLKSKVAQMLARVDELALGSVGRVPDLAADADMCLLLRVEVPQSAICRGSARFETRHSAGVS